MNLKEFFISKFQIEFIDYSRLKIFMHLQNYKRSSCIVYKQKQLVNVH
jgi:hypothetical protein